jgi:excisionase family DNA binding protein
MSKDPKPAFFTIRDVADRFNLSARTVQRLVETGELASHKFSGAVRISEADLQSFIARSRRAVPLEG